MKEIKAIIQPFVLDKVIDALEEIPGLPGITISDVRGFGKTRDGNDPVRDVRKVKLEIMVPESMAEEVVDRLARAAHTGNPGDGKIFVIDIEDVVKIRTGEHGQDAL
ncbi:MAG: P-II family nitrogen regulator [Armatimonadetes bacterium]|nr:P-II family nitrogen regulator [Armatimonadota bacterium]